MLTGAPVAWLMGQGEQFEVCDAVTAAMLAA